jgi:FkbM family methyltransferase
MTSLTDQNHIGSNTWLLKETKGATLFDKFILNSLKVIYLGLRFLLRILLGKKRRDRLYAEKEINFRDFLYKSIEFLGLDNSLLIVFNIPKYNIKFYSRITRKVENFLIHDVYTSMSVHENDIVEHFNLKQGDIVVDVGAAFGFYTILASKRVGSNGKVIAIEAQHDSFEMLNRNIKLNRLTNVITLNCAVYSKETKVKLYSSYSIMTERAGKNTNKFVEVNANTLDNLLSQQQNGINHADINWIKIDVEGAEFEVLKGATNVLSKSKDIALLIEIHGQDSYRQVVEFLNVYNFKIEFENTYESGDKHIIVRK